MASTLPDLKNAWPALPKYREHRDYYISFGSILSALAICLLVVDISVISLKPVLQGTAATLLHAKEHDADEKS
jgi:hypothetical protein